MAVFVMPHDVGVRSVRLWVGWWQEGVRPELDLVIILPNGDEVHRRLLDNTTWKAIGRRGNWTPGPSIPIPSAPVCRFRVEEVTQLAGNTRYFARIVETRDGTLHAGCVFDTLPIQLLPDHSTSLEPHLRPFTIMLGSCFWDESDDGSAAEAYRLIYADGRYTPHVKILAGDQVYVDQPPILWADPRVSGGDIRAIVTARYHAAWHKLQPLLERGANFCSTDDHEFWNDYPFRPLPAWLAHQSDGTRRRIGLETRQFAREIQQARAIRQFDIGDQLSVFVAESRLHRTETMLMRPADLAALEAWVAGLRSPGVLVLGQPLLSSPLGKVLQVSGTWQWVAASDAALLGGGSFVAGLVALLLDEEGEVSDHNPHTTRRSIGVLSEPCSAQVTTFSYYPAISTLDGSRG